MSKDGVDNQGGVMMLPGGVPIKVWPFLKHDGRIRFVAGEAYSHCADCMQKAVNDFNEEFAIVQTAPPTLLSRHDGQLFELFDADRVREPET